MTDLTPESERTALEDLLQSDGWEIYMAHVARAWGPEAMEAALRTAKANSSPEDWPFESTRILDAFAAMRADLKWPEARVRSLKAGEKTAKHTFVDRFKELRRA